MSGMLTFHKLSIVIPVFNEAATIGELLTLVSAVELPGLLAKEIIVIDDQSTDATLSLVSNFSKLHSGVDIKVQSLPSNAGKGAALNEGIRIASGEIIVIQDADLEYQPRDYLLMLKPILEGRAEVVYGSRFLLRKPVTNRIHRFINLCLTVWSNFFTGLKLTDVYTCLKMFRSDLIKSITLEEKRFGFCAEVTAKLGSIQKRAARKGDTETLRLVEVPISYRPRSFVDGKKVRFRDGIRAIYCAAKYSRY